MTLKSILRVLLAVFMIGAGVLHFTDAARFMAMMPRWFPVDPLWVTWISGVFELALGAALLWPRARELAGLGLIGLYVVVFPVNVHMALEPEATGVGDVAPWLLWARLPLQGVLIAWAWWVSRPDPAKSSGH